MQTIKRLACRALLLSPCNKILLIKMENPETGWEGWITPGGGMDAGEDEAAALKRELHEELGLSACEIGRCIWQREHTFPWKGVLQNQHEKFYLVRVSEFNPEPTLAADAPERGDLKAFKWWGLAEILRSCEAFAPRELGVLVKRLLDEGVPPTPVQIIE